MKPGLLRVAVALEVVVSFALPAYLLGWGLLTFPYWTGAASDTQGQAAIYVACIVGGCLGIWGLVRVLRSCLGRQGSRRPHLGLTAALGFVGLLSLWAPLTGSFTAFELEFVTMMSLLAPTFAGMHLLIWAWRRS